MSESCPPQVLSGSGIPKTTEYRSQFAWPRAALASVLAAGSYNLGNKYTIVYHQPRKSISMDAIKSAREQQSRNASGANSEPADAPPEQPTASEPAQDLFVTSSTYSPSELRAIVEQIIPAGCGNKVTPISGENPINGFGTDFIDGVKSPEKHAKKYKTEYSAKFKPFGKYVYTDGNWMKLKNAVTEQDRNCSWIGEVLDARQKAGHYRYRSWGTRTADDKDGRPETARVCEIERRKTQEAIALANLVSRQQNALKKKEEMEKKERREKPRSAPPPTTTTTSTASAHHQPTARSTNNTDTTTNNQPRTKPISKPAANQQKEPAVPPPRKVRPLTSSAERGRSQSTRHHLERTTPASDGSLLTSPTRDNKPEPTSAEAIEQAKMSRAFKSAPNRPNKTAANAARSSSVGPLQSRSPKRYSSSHHAAVTHSASHIPSQPSSKHPPPPTDFNENDENVVAISPNTAVRRPRPTSLSTNASRLRTSSTPPPVHSVPKQRARASPAGGDKVEGEPSKKVAVVDPGLKDGNLAGTKGTAKSDAVPDEGASSSSGPPVRPHPERPKAASRHASGDSVIRPALVKTPPEPTRVKSPEQIMMKSPEPQHWTVQLERTTELQWRESPLAAETRPEFASPKKDVKKKSDYASDNPSKLAQKTAVKLINGDNTIETDAKKGSNPDEALILKDGVSMGSGCDNTDV